ncbi:MAG: dihydropyrimidinase, partial [Anaerolineaceae bacterium]|nr:dihydropyrimidinase [Anaerolineaceae bacterium]
MTLRLIKSGTVVTAAETFEADILIDGEQISQIGSNLSAPEHAEVIDARGKLVMPGGVDVHTHFDLPMFGTVSSDDHYTGHKAAAFGGTTTVIDFVPQDQESLRANVDAWHAKVDPKAAIDFSFHMNISQLTPAVEAEIPNLLEEGITTLKVFTAYNDRLRLQDSEIFRVLRIAHQHGFLTMLHAENGDMIDTLVAEALAAGHTTPEWHAKTRPAWGAVEAGFRVAAMAATADAPLYIVHMNAGGEVDMLDYARRHGLPVMGETCPQYLFFTEDDLRRPDGAKWICSPPMRTAADNIRLWQGLTDSIIQVVATDHCAFFYDGTRPIAYEGAQIAILGKELGVNDFTKIPNGLPGVGDRLPLMWSYGVGQHKLTPNQFVALN